MDEATTLQVAIEGGKEKYSALLNLFRPRRGKPVNRAWTNRSAVLGDQFLSDINRQLHETVRELVCHPDQRKVDRLINATVETLQVDILRATEHVGGSNMDPAVRLLVQYILYRLMDDSTLAEKFVDTPQRGRGAPPKTRAARRRAHQVCEAVLWNGATSIEQAILMVAELASKSESLVRKDWAAHKTDVLSTNTLVLKNDCSALMKEAMKRNKKAHKNAN